MQGSEEPLDEDAAGSSYNHPPPADVTIKPSKKNGGSLKSLPSERQGREARKGGAQAGDAESEKKGDWVCRYCSHLEAYEVPEHFQRVFSHERFARVMIDQPKRDVKKHWRDTSKRTFTSWQLRK